MADTGELHPPSDTTVPAKYVRTVSPHATNNLPVICRALYVGTGGDVSVIAAGDTDPKIWKNVPDGGYILCRTKAVRESGTTADDILALY